LFHKGNARCFEDKGEGGTEEEEGEEAVKRGEEGKAYS